MFDLNFTFWLLDFFPTKKFRFGIYFPPGEKENSGWVLEGNGKMTLYSKAETYFLDMDKNLGMYLFPSGVGFKERFSR